MTVHDSNNVFNTENIGGENESLKHVHLCSSNFVVSVFLVPESVLIVPVISLSLSVEWISEVRWSRGGNPVGWSISAKEVVSKLLVLAFIIVLDDTKVS